VAILTTLIAWLHLLATDPASAVQAFLAALPALGHLVPLAAGMAAKDKKSLVLARNLARETKLLRPPRELERFENETIQVPVGDKQYDETRGPVVGYRPKENTVVYVPESLAEALAGLPAEAQVVVAGLCTTFLEQADDEVRKYHKKYPGLTHGAIKTSLRELAKKLGLTQAGENFRMIARTLETLVHTHVRGFVMASKDGQEIKIGLGRLLTWVAFGWSKDDIKKKRIEAGKVEVTICPALTDFLLSEECYHQRVEIPVEALRRLRAKRKRSKYSIPLFLFLLAAKPGNGAAFRIGWEKAAERACIPDVTESGRRMRPSERKKLLDKVMRDIAEATDAFSVTSKDGMCVIRYRQKTKKRKDST
jgi:hypothetical protein